MSTGQIIQTVLMGLVFIAWAALMLRAVSLWRSRAHEAGGSVPRQIGHWLRAPEDKSERSTLMFLSVVLLVMVGTTLTLG
ncbi:MULTISPECIES: hypothetical protein [Roseicyclus]|jgi:hypothetical protein|uniref:hypothetical protein n=1 Tax=Roseicyclus amphidinii TaxID=3034232 RepID=UPI0024E0B172|nr:hypothetical protein [Roseicyclus sp. Amp-Y-6]